MTCISHDGTVSYSPQEARHAKGPISSDVETLGIMARYYLKMVVELFLCIFGVCIRSYQLAEGPGAFLSKTLNSGELEKN